MSEETQSINDQIGKAICELAPAFSDPPARVNAAKIKNLLTEARQGVSLLLSPRDLENAGEEIAALKQVNASLKEDNALLKTQNDDFKALLDKIKAKEREEKQDRRPHAQENILKALPASIMPSIFVEKICGYCGLNTTDAAVHLGILKGEDFVESASVGMRWKRRDKGDRYVIALKLLGEDTEPRRPLDQETILAALKETGEMKAEELAARVEMPVSQVDDALTLLARDGLAEQYNRHVYRADSFHRAGNWYLLALGTEYLARIRMRESGARG